MNWGYNYVGHTARKELFILSIALLIEVTRMLLVDIFVLRDYFSGRSYSIFRAPRPCEGEDGWCTQLGPAVGISYQYNAMLNA